MRRPNMLKYNTWIGECVEYFKICPEATPSDKRLAAWVQLLSISEQIATAFSFDDLTRIANMAQPETRYLLEGFKDSLSDWRVGIDSRLMNGTFDVYRKCIDSEI